MTSFRVGDIVEVCQSELVGFDTRHFYDTVYGYDVPDLDRGLPTLRNMPVVPAPCPLLVVMEEPTLYQVSKYPLVKLLWGGRVVFIEALYCRHVT